jgi:outer membrane receptor for ferrienterochelin and colicins
MTGLMRRNVFARGLRRPAAAMVLVAASSAVVTGAEPEPERDLTALSFEELAKVNVETVYAAARRVQRVTDVPASVSLVTAEEIRFYGHRTLADVLRSVRGIDATHDRNYGYLGIRGFNRPGDFGGRILLLVDGHRLNDSLYDSAYNLMDFILDVDLIERVEVVRGPGSVIYGNNAFFGVVNVVTRRGRSIDGAEVAASYGSYDTYTGRMTYGSLFKNGVELAISGTVFGSDGVGALYYPEYDNPLENNGRATGVDGEFASSGFLSLAYGDFTLQGGYVEREKSVPTGSYGTVFNDPVAETFDARGFAGLRYEHEFANEWSVMSRVYYDNMRYEAPYPYEVPDRVINRDIGRSDWIGIEAQVTKTIFDAHKITAGAEYRYDIRMEQANFDEEPFQEYLNSNEERHIVGVYGQGEAWLHKNLSITAGARYDYYSTFGGTVNPRAGLVFKPFEETALKLLYGQAYRAPNAYEVFYEGPTSKPNPGLEPETVRTYEAVLEQYLGSVYRASLSVFYVDARELINLELDPDDGLTIFRNRDRIESYGVESELEARWDSGIRARASYTYQETEDELTGDRISNSPAHLGKANLTVPVFRQTLFSGLELQGASSRRTLAGNETGSSLVLNATLYARDLVEGLDLSISIYNLLDRTYYFPGAPEHRQDRLAADGRSYRVKLGYEF